MHRSARNFPRFFETLEPRALLSAATTTTVDSTLGPTVYGQAASFTATITPDGGDNPVSGSVQFIVDGKKFGTPITVDAGVAISGDFPNLSAGKHVIKANYTPDVADFLASAGSLTHTVDKATINIAGDSYSRQYGQANPLLWGDVAGLAFGQQIVPIFTPASTKFSHPGDYPINCTVRDPQGVLKNYDVVFTPGTLTITKADPVVIWPAPADIFSGQPIAAKQLNAKIQRPAGASPGGAATYNYAIGDILDEGENTLSVSFDETQDYNAASADVTLNVRPNGPDLKVTIGKIAPGTQIRPGTTLRVPVIVQNVGDQTAEATKDFPIQVQLYNTVDGYFDPSAPTIGVPLLIKKPLHASAKKTLTAFIDIPADYLGSYFINAAVAVDPNVGGDTTGDNDFTDGAEITVQNQFGKVPGGPNVNFTGDESDGTRYTFSLTGPGYGVVIFDAGNIGIQLFNTTLASNLTITTTKSNTPGDDGLLTLGYVFAVNFNTGVSQLNSIKALTTRMGDVNVNVFKSLSVYAVVNGVIQIGVTSATLSVLHDVDNSFVTAVGSVSKFTVGGNIVNSHLAFQNPYYPTPALGALAAKEIVNSEIRFFGQVTSFKTDLLENSQIYSGLLGNKGGNFPLVAEDWFSHDDRQRIDTLTIGTFTNSLVGVVRLGSVKITTVTDNDPAAAGFGFTLWQLPTLYTGPASTGDYVSPLDGIL